MTPLARAGVVLLALAAAWAIVRLVETRRPRRGLSLRPGVTIATGPDCRTCEAAVAAISGLVGGVPLDVVPAHRLPGAAIRSVPTVLVADSSGRVIMRRSGKTAVSDARLIVETARGVGSGVA